MVKSFLCAGFLALVATAAGAKEPLISVVAGFPPGGPSTIVARHMADSLEKHLGVSTIVENKPGASGRIAAEYVRRQNPDGRTLLVMASTSVLRVDPYGDLVPVGRISRFDFIFAVHKNTKSKSFDEYVSRVSSGEIAGNYTTPGAGSVPHLLLEQLAEDVAIKLQQHKRLPLVHVPHQGSVAAVQSVIGGHVPAGMFGLSEMRGALDSGVTPLFIGSSERSLQLPDVPTLTELGYGLDSSGWHALYVHKDTDPAWIEKLRGAVTRAAQTLPPALKQLGFVGAATGGEKMQRIHRREYERWGAVAKRIGIQF